MYIEPTQYSHYVICNKVHRHCKQVHHLDSFAKVLLLSFYNLHRMCQLDVPHFVVTVVSVTNELLTLLIGWKFIKICIKNGRFAYAEMRLTWRENWRFRTLKIQKISETSFRKKNSLTRKTTRIIIIINYSLLIWATLYRC